jgi:diguanylate cyclase (GGDEF)-like protein/PAS domain S-box-containing protein
MSEQQYKHLLVVEDSRSKRIVPLEENTYSLGRATSNSIILYDALVSRYHATLLRTNDVTSNDFYYWLIDGDLKGHKSTNGIIINGHVCSAHKLKNGDTVVFAKDTKATYYITNNPSEIDAEAALNPTALRERAREIVREEPIIEPVATEAKRVKRVLNDEMKRTMFFNDEPKPMTQEEVARLSSFPELDPNPIVETNLEGDFIYANSAALKTFKTIYQEGINHPIVAGLQLQLEENNNFRREIKVVDRYYEQHIHYFVDRKTIRSYLTDITSSKQLKDSLKENLPLYEAVKKQISEGLLLVDAETKKIIDANNNYCSLIGYNREELLQLTIYQVIGRNAESFNKNLQRILAEKCYFVGESVHRRKDGNPVDIEESISVTSWKEKNIFCFTIKDITERKKSEERLHHQVFHDSLTGLPNRKLFSKQLEEGIIKAQNTNSLLSVMFLDVDRFKNINDSLGHEIGDLLLQGLAQRLKSCLRDRDIIARWGGDEFTLILNQISSLEEPAKIGQRLLDALQAPFNIQEHQLHVRSSIGIAVYPKDGESAETLIKNADAALHRTKQKGKNNYNFYTSTMNDEASEMLRLETFLHGALERQEFVVYYQPQVNINTKKICGVEALIRWEHPELGLVSPAKFIPLAEEMGSIVPIGEWVLRAACEQSITWQQMGLPSLKVSVNISPRQFQEENLVDKIAEILAETGLVPNSLELEITETTIVQNVDFARRALRNLHNMGINVSMDDFGTGYSSLGYLKKFSFQTLKIDQSFVRDLQDNPQDKAIISAIVTLGRGFNLRVVAEGVETVEQLEMLRALNCEEMQGYWFSRPLPANEATLFLCNHFQAKV